MSPWPRVSLGVVAELVDYGVTASASSLPTGPKFLRITDIQDGSVDWATVPRCECSAKESAGSRLQIGDIVFARTGATTGKSFLIRACPEDAVFASYLIRVRLGHGVDPRYVSAFFQSEDYWAQITKGARGAAQPGVNATTLKALELPIPPLADQRRIASILDQADAIKAKRREALAQLDSLTQSIFIEMFGDFRTDHSRCRMVKFDEIVKDSRIGLVRGSQELGPENPYPYLRMNAIARDGSLQLDGALQAKASPEELGLYQLRRGDFLFNTRNSRELVGKTALFRSDDLFLFNNNLLRVRFVEGIEPEYVFAAFKTRLIQNELEIRKSGTTNVFAVYYKDLRTLPVPVPPHALQKTFSQRIQSIEAIKTIHNSALRELEGLFASLHHRAFAGEL